MRVCWYQETRRDFTVSTLLSVWNTTNLSVYSTLSLSVDLALRWRRRLYCVPLIMKDKFVAHRCNGLVSADPPYETSTDRLGTRQCSWFSLVLSPDMLGTENQLILHETHWAGTGTLKMQDRKIWDQVTGVENAGPENEGPHRIWKNHHDVSEKGLENERTSRKTIETCSAIGKPFEKQYYSPYFITVVQAPDSNSSHWCVWHLLWVSEWYCGSVCWAFAVGKQ